MRPESECTKTIRQHMHRALGHRALCVLLCAALLFGSAGALAGCGKKGKERDIKRVRERITEDIPKEQLRQDRESSGKEAQPDDAGPDRPAGVTPEDGLVGFSILGDSISTFAGVNPPGYAFAYPAGDLTDVRQTWWMQITYGEGAGVPSTGLLLRSNASFSGSTVTGSSYDESGASGISFRRTDDLLSPDGVMPDIILVQMGTNDFIQGREPGKADPRGIEGKLPGEGDVADFAGAYSLMLEHLVNKYRTEDWEADIVCLTCLPVFVFDNDERTEAHEKENDLGLTIEDYNGVIRECAEAFGLSVIDLYDIGFTAENAGKLTLDGVHPSAEGARIMAEHIAKQLLDMGLAPGPTEEFTEYLLRQGEEEAGPEGAAEEEAVSEGTGADGAGAEGAGPAEAESEEDTEEDTEEYAEPAGNEDGSAEDDGELQGIETLIGREAASADGTADAE